MGYIDKAVLLKAFMSDTICSGVPADECNALWNVGGGCFQCAVDHAPTVDAVPVVRGKDCKWSEKVCGDALCYEFMGKVTDEGYCYKGERREEENNN